MLVTPVPEVAMELGELVALLARVTFPVTLPVVVGANTTPKFADWPAAMVAPDTPLVTLKPLPLTVIPETVTLELPVFLTATSRILDTPTISLPKLRLEVDNEIVRVDRLPLPLKAIVCVGFVALLLMVITPVTLAVVAGENVTVKFIVMPGAIQSGM